MLIFYHFENHFSSLLSPPPPSPPPPPLPPPLIKKHTNHRLCRRHNTSGGDIVLSPNKTSVIACAITSLKKGTEKKQCCLFDRRHCYSRSRDRHAYRFIHSFLSCVFESKRVARDAMERLFSLNTSIGASGAGGQVFVLYSPPANNGRSREVAVYSSNDNEAVTFLRKKWFGGGRKGRSGGGHHRYQKKGGGVAIGKEAVIAIATTHDDTQEITTAAAAASSSSSATAAASVATCALFLIVSEMSSELNARVINRLSPYHHLNFHIFPTDKFQATSSIVRSALLLKPLHGFVDALHFY